jgi:hypothetical protein
MVTGVMSSLRFGRLFGNTKDQEKSQMVRDVEAVMPFDGTRAELS